jgi:hypothetical protein
MTMTMPTLAPVECTPWCIDGSGHTDAEDLEEQFCRSASHTVELAAVADGVGRAWRRRVQVHLYRDVNGMDECGQVDFDPPRIEVVGSDTEAVGLSLEEACQLGQLLIQLATTGKRSS